jgi:hypothetical protein
MGRGIPHVLKHDDGSVSAPETVCVTFKANSPLLFTAMPCRVNSHMPCRVPAILRQCRVLRESPRGSRKYSKS